MMLLSRVKQQHVQESDHVILVYLFRSCKPSWLSITSQLICVFKEGRRGNVVFKTCRQKYLADRTENIHAVCRPLNCSTCTRLADAAASKCNTRQPYPNTHTHAQPRNHGVVQLVKGSLSSHHLTRAAV